MRSALISCLWVVALCGCGSGGESNIIVAQAGPDPRFVTADALVEYYNELATAAPQDARGINELFFAENERQEQYITDNDRFIDMLDLHEALYRRFGKGYFPDMESAFEPDGPATITDRSERRAVASYTSNTGESKTLQLVQAGDRWWLSGNMLEEVRAGIPEERIREVSLVFSGVGAAGRELIPRIEQGEFASYEEASRAVWLRAIQIEPELLDYARGGG